MIDAFESARDAARDKENLIAEADRIRTEAAYNKEKEERDAAYYDLEGLMLDEEAQLNNLKEEAKYWEEERYFALEMDDINYFEEAQANFDKAQERIKTAQTKFDATAASFEIEKQIKEQREFQEEVDRQT